MSSTETPGLVAVAIGHMEVVADACVALEKREAFGFMADVSLLRQLRGAIDAAIIATGE